MHIDQAPAPRPAASELPIRFTGSGSEYFRIWIVNLLLTVLTLGIYSAWAKVRRLKYFYGNTLVADSPLDYHGTPMAILKGRLVAVVLLASWMGVQQFGSPALIGVVFVAGMAVLPWLLVRAQRFQFINTSYRGVRFGFVGTTAHAYLVYLMWPLLLVPTLYLIGPFAHQQLRKFMHDGVRYGTLPGSMNAGAGAFYVVYAITLLILIAAVVGSISLILMAIPGLMHTVTSSISGPGSKGLAGVIASVYAVVLCLVLAFILVAGPYFLVRIRNLVWNHSQLGEHQFRSRARVWPFIWITVSNFLLILITLGLFIPFAQIRKARYLVQTMALVPQGSLDEVVATQRDKVGAVGQETADMFDVDIAL